MTILSPFGRRKISPKSQVTVTSSKSCKELLKNKQENPGKLALRPFKPVYNSVLSQVFLLEKHFPALRWAKARGKNCCQQKKPCKLFVCVYLGFVEAGGGGGVLFRQADFLEGRRETVATN